MKKMSSQGGACREEHGAQWGWGQAEEQNIKNDHHVTYFHSYSSLYFLNIHSANIH